MKEDISIIVKQAQVDELTATEQYNIDNNIVNSIIRILNKKNNSSNNLSNIVSSNNESIHQKKIKELREILNEKDKILNSYKN